jgi:hypothetical protein
MLDDLIKDMRELRQADTLLGQIWLRQMARRFGLYALAALIGLFGLGMLNFALYLGLLPFAGPVGAAAGLAAADLIIAGLIFLMGSAVGLGADGEAALHTRQDAIAAVDTDGKELRATIDGLRQDIRGIHDTVAAFINNPLDAAAQKLLIPAATSVLNGFRTNKKQDT